MVNSIVQREKKGIFSIQRQAEPTYKSDGEGFTPNMWSKYDYRGLVGLNLEIKDPINIIKKQLKGTIVKNPLPLFLLTFDIKSLRVLKNYMGLVQFWV